MHEKAHGRITTTDNFIPAGATPDQAELYYRDSTRIVFKDGKAVPVVDAPQEALPDGWISKAEYEHGRKPQLKKERKIPQTGEVGENHKSLPQPQAEHRGEEASIERFFPDWNEDRIERTERRKGKSGSPFAADAFPDLDRTSANESRFSFLRRIASAALAGGIKILTGSAPAHASKIDEVLFAANPAVKAFGRIADEMAQDRRRIEAEARRARTKRDARGAEDAEAEACGRCRLAPEDLGAEAFPPLEDGAKAQMPPASSADPLM